MPGVGERLGTGREWQESFAGSMSALSSRENLLFH
jgi:hypothetical protein